jgi:ABC-type glycerol-3-phosphate transport system substrate-binding protein
MGEARTSIVYTDLWFVGAKSKHPREAWEFVKYLSSAPVQKSYVEIADLPPARISALGPYMQRSLQDILANRTGVEEGLAKAAEAVRAYLNMN